MRVDARCTAGNIEEDQLIEGWQQKQRIYAEIAGGQKEGLHRQISTRGPKM